MTSYQCSLYTPWWIPQKAPIMIASPALIAESAPVETLQEITAVQPASALAPSSILPAPPPTIAPPLPQPHTNAPVASILDPVLPATAILPGVAVPDPATAPTMAPILAPPPTNASEPIDNGQFYMVECPHCQGGFIIAKNEINCGIFRHGTMKVTGQPINPHESQAECDRLVREDLIRGCGKPFRVERNGEAIIVAVCGYI
jgi:hypothetical protein